MNEHSIEEVIGTLYEMVQDARSVPSAATNARSSVSAYWICLMKSAISSPES